MLTSDTLSDICAGTPAARARCRVKLRRNCATDSSRRHVRRYRTQLKAEFTVHLAELEAELLSLPLPAELVMMHI